MKIRFFISLLIGIFGSFIFPPVSSFLPWLSMIALFCFISYILYLIDTAKSWKQVFKRVFLVYLIANFFAYSWILKPFYFLPISVWLIKIISYSSLFLFASYISLFSSIAGVITFYAKKNRCFIFATSITLLEWIRGWLFTGLPWNLFSSVADNILLLQQSLSIIGSYGLSLCLVYIASIPYMLYKKKKREVLAPVLLASVLIIFGGVRFYTNLDMGTTGLKLRLIDARLSQYDVMDKKTPEKYVKLAKKKGWENIDLFVLPETSSPFDLTNNGYYETVYSNINNSHSSVVVGFNRYANFDEVTEDYDIYNSLALVDKDGVQYVYDKQHLVPFGEYIPFNKLLGLEKFTAGAKDFSEGEIRKPFTINNIKFLPLICYEAIFSGLGIDKNIDAILNISNDAWFGESGKVQHLQMAKFRAVEEGLPVIRVSNEGALLGSKSAVIITPTGTTLSQDTVCDKDGCINNITLPKRLNRTFFSYTGNLLVILFCILVLSWNFNLCQCSDFTKKK